MKFFAKAAILLAIAVSIVPAAYAENYPVGECALSSDRSTINLVVSNGGNKRYACTASCQYKITGQRPLQTFSCNYALSANTPGKIACDLEGGSANHFSEIRPTKFVCQPR